MTEVPVPRAEVVKQSLDAVRKSLLDNPSLPNRVHAKRGGCSESVPRRIRKELENAGLIPRVGIKVQRTPPSTPELRERWEKVRKSIIADPHLPDAHHSRIAGFESGGPAARIRKELERDGIVQPRAHISRSVANDSMRLHKLPTLLAWQQPVGYVSRYAGTLTRYLDDARFRGNRRILLLKYGSDLIRARNELTAIIERLEDDGE